MRISDWSSDVCSSDLLAADGENGLRLAVAGLLGRAAGAVALDDEQLRPRRIVIGAVGELAGEAELARRGRGLALHLAFGAALQPLVHPVENEAQTGAAAVHIVGQEMVEMIADRRFDAARRGGAGEAEI